MGNHATIIRPSFIYGGYCPAQVTGELLNAKAHQQYPAQQMLITRKDFIVDAICEVTQAKVVYFIV